MLAATGEFEFFVVVRATERSPNFPRKTRLRTLTGRKKPVYFGWIHR